MIPYATHSSWGLTLRSFIFPAIYIGCKVWNKDKIVRLQDFDFDTEFAKMEEEDQFPEQSVPLSRYDQFLNMFF